MQPISSKWACAARVHRFPWPPASTCGWPISSSIRRKKRPRIRISVNEDLTVCTFRVRKLGTRSAGCLGDLRQRGPVSTGSYHVDLVILQSEGLSDHVSQKFFEQ